MFKIPKKFVSIAEELDWKIDIDETNEISLETYSDASQDFLVYLNPKTLSKQEIISELRSYIQGFDPVEEAMKWVGPDGHGQKGAPEDFDDIVADMQNCLERTNELLNAWMNESTPPTGMPLLTVSEIAEKVKELLDNKYSKYYGPFGISKEESKNGDINSVVDIGGTWEDDPFYLTKIKNPTGTAVLLSWRFGGDFSKSIVIPEREFDNKRNLEQIQDAVESFLLKHYA